jgi:hypothetical protein
MPREPVDRQRIERFLVELGKRFRRSGKVFLVGGTTMVYEGFRAQTLDIDLTFDVQAEDRSEFIRTVRELKDELDINVEEVSPGDFIPLPAGYEHRAQFIGRYGQLDVFHFDPYSTALSKIERGTEEDFADVLALLRSGRIEADQLRSSFRFILRDFEIASLRGDPEEFQRKFNVLMEMWSQEQDTTHSPSGS